MHARVLRYLDEVVRRGSIRKAAEHLHVAPTAVNRQILDLEAELGAPLFDRIHNRLRLTQLPHRLGCGDHFACIRQNFIVSTGKARHDFLHQV